MRPFDYTLNERECRTMLSEVDLNRLAQAFNSRKPRKGKKPILVQDFHFGASGHIACSGPVFYGHYGTVTQIEEAIETLMQGVTADLVCIREVRLTHDAIGTIPASSIAVELPESAQAEILARNAHLVNEMLTARVAELRTTLQHRKAQIVRHEEEQVQKATRERRAKLDNLDQLRRLSPAAAKGLQTVALVLQTLEGVTPEAREHLEGLLIEVVDESKKWDAAVRAARQELQAEMGVREHPRFVSIMPDRHRRY